MKNQIIACCHINTMLYMHLPKIIENQNAIYELQQKILEIVKENINDLNTIEEVQNYHAMLAPQFVLFQSQITTFVTDSANLDLISRLMCVLIEQTKNIVDNKVEHLRALLEKLKDPFRNFHSDIMTSPYLKVNDYLAPTHEAERKKSTTQNLINANVWFF